MYGKAKGTTVPSDAQSKEKLAFYVYEYLVHIGAQKTANVFLQEIRWDKSTSVGEPPGFLHSWWNVFWDLYSAAPERRDTHEHSNEAKAFHDYGFVNSGYPNGLPHSNHPVMSGPGGVGGPAGAGMPPPLCPPGPDPLAMRQRPSGPPLMPGSGLPPGAGPSPHHPSMRFHQAAGGGAGGGGGYPGIPVGGLLPPHANLMPNAGPPHPMHGGPMMPQQQQQPQPPPHHHHHPGAILGHPRPRMMGPSMAQAQPPLAQQPQPPMTQPAPIVCCSGSAGPNSVSSAGPGSVGPGSCGAGQGANAGGGAGPGIVQSPGHPGTPTQHLQQQQHMAVPSPISNQPPQPPQQQQQTPPASSNPCLPPEYTTRPSPHLVFSGAPPSSSTPDGPLFGSEQGLLNGSGVLVSSRSGMMPPPPPDYAAAAGCYPGDLKASPLHQDMLGPVSQQQQPQPLMPSDYGNGAGGFGGGPPPDSVLMMPPQHHMVVSQAGQPPPPPQYVTQQQQAGQSPAAGQAGAGSVQFPQEYSFNQLS